MMLKLKYPRETYQIFLKVRRLMRRSRFRNRDIEIAIDMALQRGRQMLAEEMTKLTEQETGHDRQAGRTDRDGRTEHPN